MKAVQAWILRNILQRLRVSSACMGFEREKCIRDNAEPHAGAVAVLCLDIEDFFPSVRASQVCNIFKAAGYSPRIAAMLAAICTFRNRLPQGGPCSPKLANLVCLHLDLRLQGYVGKRGIVYTRYADDLTFSSYSVANLQKALPTIRAIVRGEGFRLNSDKERLRGPSVARKVTGLVLSEDGVGIGRAVLRELRAKLHHLAAGSASTPADLAHVCGWLAFVKSVDKKRQETLAKYIVGLRKKYPGSSIEKLQ